MRASFLLLLGAIFLAAAPGALAQATPLRPQDRLPHRRRLPTQVGSAYSF
jgi:hypothetical protein